MVAVNDGTLPTPLPPRPIALLLLVQVKVAPAGLLVKVLAGTVAPRHTATFGLGTTPADARTTTIKVMGGPAQPPKLGVTVIVPCIGVVVGLAAVKAGTVPLPLAARPIAGLLLVQV